MVERCAVDQVDDALLDMRPDAGAGNLTGGLAGEIAGGRCPSGSCPAPARRRPRRSASSTAAGPPSPGGRRRGSARPPEPAAPWRTGPIRCAGRSSSASSRSSETARWAPRLVYATACTSSTMTVCTPVSISRARLVSSRNSDSGVVIRMSAPSRANARRSPDGVSPDRTATLMSGMGDTAPGRDRADARSSGDRRLRSTSTASALSGDRYSTEQRARGSAGGSVRRATRSLIADRNAASVLPEPVGATTRVCSPRPIASQAPVWAAVGSANAPVNQSRTSGSNRCSAGSADPGCSTLATRPLCGPPPTTPRRPLAAMTRALEYEGNRHCE